MHPLCKDTDAGRRTKLTLCAHLVRLLHLNSFRCPALSVADNIARFSLGFRVSIGKRRASTQRVAGRRVVAGRYNPPQDHPNL